MSFAHRCCGNAAQSPAVTLMLLKGFCGALEMAVNLYRGYIHAHTYMYTGPYMCSTSEPRKHRCKDNKMTCRWCTHSRPLL